MYVQQWSKKLKKAFITYDNEGKEKTLSKSEKNEKLGGGYVRIYEWGKTYATEHMNARSQHWIYPSVR